MMKNIAKGFAAAAALTLVMAAAVPAYAGTQPANQTIDQNQDGFGGNGPFGVNLAFFQFGNEATIDTSAFENASGNINANVTAGNGNQQVNLALVDAHSPTYAFSGDYEQVAAFEGTVFSGAEKATITDNAFAYAAGQMGVNVASGIWNQQGNAAFIVKDDTLSGATVYMSQTDATVSYTHLTLPTILRV